MVKSLVLPVIRKSALQVEASSRNLLSLRSLIICNVNAYPWIWVKQKRWSPSGIQLHRYNCRRILKGDPVETLENQRLAFIFVWYYAFLSSLLFLLLLLFSLSILSELILFSAWTGALTMIFSRGNSWLQDFKRLHETSSTETSNFSKTSKDFRRLQKTSKDFKRL